MGDPLTYIFGYGTLELGEDPPKTVILDFDDKIWGDMFDLGDYPAAINVGVSENIIQGQVELIDEMELAKLDKREFPEYRRTKVTTFKGYSCWVYEWLDKIPFGAQRIEKWES